MIKNILIQGHKSFHKENSDPISFETTTQKPVFIYGLNGAGKTAIGEVIQGIAGGDPIFQTCKMEVTPGGPFRFLVYNHHFAESVIGEAQGMPGIFTIGELDTETQRKIEMQAGILRGVREQRASNQRNITRLQAELTNALDDAKDAVWTEYKNHDKGRFDRFLTGYGRGSQKFFDDLRKYETPDNQLLENLNSLQSRLADISGEETLKSTHTLFLDAFLPIEQNQIWQEQVEVSGESRLAPLIAKLGNGDWVSEGRAFLHDDQCPFCQEALPHGFVQELTKLLDGERQQKLALIDIYIQRYETAIQTLQSSIETVFSEPLSQELGMKSLWDALLSKLKANLAAMRLKRITPSSPVDVTPCDITALQAALASLNSRIWEFNQRIQNKAREEKSIREGFWKIMCRNRIETYRSYDTRVAPIKENLRELEIAEQEATRLENECTITLGELRKKQEGVDASVEAMNERLKQLGIDSFFIARKKHEGSLYCLERPAHGESSTRALSEGEKTLLSFLYFVELLKGSREQGAAVDIGKTVAVIDDPISSLSHNFVYDIASIICHELIKPIGGQKLRQIIVLTHNLFFFHELVHQIAGGRLEKAGNKCQLIRVVKGEYSKAVPMNARDFANDYDALWHVLQDAKSGAVRIQVVPNTMRCILENFFSFTGKTEQFEEILKKISSEEGKFRPLERFLNRGSHRDPVNIAYIDWGQFDITYYLAKLKAVFEATGHLDHYRLKMNELETEAKADTA